MLQQTQVATVVRFFKPFLKAFPTLTALAAASEQDVLRCWQGLGYYRRARDLHRSAQQLAARYGNRVPADPGAWCGVPGLGRYTRNAILSQAFDQRLPILEANSQRVLCRLFGRTDDPRSGSGQRWLWRTAEMLLPPRRVGDFNQALMELGALVCTPSAPRCGICPLAPDCVGRRLGLQEKIPVRVPAPALVEVKEVALVVHHGPRVLLVQRPQEGRWAGLWEFPRGPVAAGEARDVAACRLLPRLTGIRAKLEKKLTTIRHSITHHRITLVCFEARYLGGIFRPFYYHQGRWVEPAKLAEFPASSPQRRLTDMLLGQQQRTIF